MLTEQWRRSERSNTNGACVEARLTENGTIQMRNSRHAAGEILEFTAQEWDAFLDGVHNGEFEI